MPKRKLGAFLYLLCLICLFSLIVFGPIGSNVVNYYALTPSPTSMFSAPFILATPIPVTPTQTVSPLSPHVAKNEIANGDVSLEIPSISVNTKVEIATVVDTEIGPSLSTPDDNPLWIPDWSSEFGLPGISMIYGHRQWGPVHKIFSNLDDLNIGDKATISSAEYQFVYSVYEAVIINPEDIWTVAIYHDQMAKIGNRNELMLITCTPWGTDQLRLIVFLSLEAVNVLP